MGPVVVTLRLGLGSNILIFRMKELKVKEYNHDECYAFKLTNSIKLYKDETGLNWGIP